MHQYQVKANFNVDGSQEIQIDCSEYGCQKASTYYPICDVLPTTEYKIDVKVSKPTEVQADKHVTQASVPANKKPTN